MTVLSRDPAAFQARYPETEGQPELDFVRGDVIQVPIGERSFDYVIHAATDTTAVADTAGARVILLQRGHLQSLPAVDSCTLRGWPQWEQRKVSMTASRWARDDPASVP